MIRLLKPAAFALTIITLGSCSGAQKENQAKEEKKQSEICEIVEMELKHKKELYSLQEKRRVEFKEWYENEADTTLDYKAIMEKFENEVADQELTQKIETLEADENKLAEKKRLVKDSGKSEDEIMKELEACPYYEELENLRKKHLERMERLAI